jgi:hypothetical protein
MSLRRRLSNIEASPDSRRPGLEKLTNPFMFEVTRERPDFLMQNLLLDSSAGHTAWTVNARSLLEIARLTRQLDAELIVHVFPADVQVQETHYAFYQALGIHTDPRFLTTARPQERLTRFCAAARLRCYDLLPALRNASGRELYLEQDTHLNAEGNRVAFEQIRRNLSASPEPTPRLARAQLGTAPGVN